MSKLLGIFFGIISAVSYGTNPLFGVRLIRDGFPVDSMIFWRFAGAALVLFPIAYAASKGKMGLTKTQLLWCALLGFLFAVSGETLFWAFTVMSAGVASTLLFFYPIFVALIMAVFFGEKVGKSVIAAIILSTIGVAFLSLDESESTFDLLGAFFIMLSALSYAVYMVIIKVTSAAKLDSLKLTFYALAFASAAAFAKAALSGGLRLPVGDVQIENVVGLIIFPTAVSITAIAYSIKYAGPTIAAILGALEPVTAVAVSVFFLGEGFSPNLAVGIALIIIAVAIITLGKTSRENAEK